MLCRWVWAALLLALGTIVPVSLADVSATCRALTRQFYDFNQKEAAPFTGDNMVYFLHIPRTAGRTFHSCFLKQGYAPSKRCPKAYDHLRINFTVPSCKLLSSHDDFSVVELLPPNTAVVSQFRDPVDRFLSAYEFAVEVAARQLKRPKTFKNPAGRVVTDDVWPWSHLIPFFKDDFTPKVEAAQAKARTEGFWKEHTTPDGSRYYHNEVRNVSKWTLSDEEKARMSAPINPYDNELVMPLREFVRHPIAQELLHENEAMQVLGLSNYSHWDKAEQMRDCILAEPEVASEMLEFAKKRVRRFAHAGTTDMLHESVESCAAALDLPLDGNAFAAGESRSANTELQKRGLLSGDYSRSSSDSSSDSSGDEGSDSSGTDDAYSEGGSNDVINVYDLAAADMQRAEMAILAEDVRGSRQAVDAAKLAWNEAVQAEAAPEVLGTAKRRLQETQAEYDHKQSLLLDARREERHLRKRAVHGKKDARLAGALGAEYQRCANKAQSRNKDRKDKSLANLGFPDGRHVSFSKEARNAIPADIIEDIRQRNRMDSGLHQLAQEMLKLRRRGQEQAGKLQRLRDSKSDQHGGGPARLQHVPGHVPADGEL